MGTTVAMKEQSGSTGPEGHRGPAAVLSPQEDTDDPGVAGALGQQAVIDDEGFTGSCSATRPEGAMVDTGSPSQPSTAGSTGQRPPDDLKPSRIIGIEEETMGAMEAAWQSSSSTKPTRRYGSCWCASRH